MFGVLVIFVTFAAIWIVSFVGMVLALLLWPGRKGWMRSTREFRLPGQSVEQAWDTLAGRLEYERFDVDRSQRPHALRAARPATPHVDAPGGVPVFSNATKPLGVEARFAPVGGGGVGVMVAMWTNDFVLQDTGEGRQVDLMLDRVIEAQLDRDPPPVQPTTPTTAPLGLAQAAGALVAAALPMAYPGFASRWIVPYAVGVILAALLAWSFGTETRKQARNRPAELLGGWIGYAIYVLAAAAIVLAAVPGVTRLLQILGWDAG